MVVTLGKGRTRSLNYSLSTKARFVLQRKFEEWGPRSKTLLRKRNIHAVLTWHCVILAETHAHWRWFFTWHRTWHNSVVTDIWPLTPWMLQWGTGISRYQLQSQGIMQSNNCLHVWPRTIYKGSETSERDLENKHAMVKRDLPGHQIQPFLLQRKKWKPGEEHWLIQDFLLGQTEIIIAKEVLRKGVIPRAGFNFRGKAILWEVKFELGVEGLLKCVSSGVNWGLI